MSLHHRARDHLFKSFVSRNYSGLNESIKSEILKLHPDQILSLVDELKENERFRLDLERLSNIFTNSRPPSKFHDVLQVLVDFLKSKFIFFLEYQPNQKKYKRQNTQGSVSKIIKQWQPNEFQTTFLLDRQQANGPVPFKPDERQDFFQDIDDEFDLYPMNSGKSHYGYMAIPTGELETLPRAFLGLVTSISVDLYNLEQESLERQRYKRALDSQTKFIQNTISELSHSASFNADSLPIITKRLGFDPWVLFKRENNKLISQSSSGIRGFKLTNIPVKRELLMAGSTNSQIRLYVQEYLDHFSYSPKSIYIQPVGIEKDFYIYFFDLKKSVSSQQHYLRMIGDLIYAMGGTQKIETNVVEVDFKCLHTGLSKALKKHKVDIFLLYSPKNEDKGDALFKVIRKSLPKTENHVYQIAFNGFVYFPSKPTKLKELEEFLAEIPKKQPRLGIVKIANLGKSHTSVNDLIANAYGSMVK